jgi:GNAT superfamily N-acetyltransferase
VDTLSFIHDYKERSEYRQSFNQLAKDTFGIDFEEWYKQGFWNDRYVCYSFIDGDRVVANVSANKMDLIVEGKPVKAIQIGTVMTDPDHRGMGLAKSLLNKVLEKYEKEYDLIYLFANRNVLKFYPKFGFKPFQETEFSMEISVQGVDSIGVRKLDVSKAEDLDIIVRVAPERASLSRLLSVKNSENLLVWYRLNVFTEDLYYLEEQDTIVIFKLEEDKIHLYDIVSKSVVSLTRY